MTHLEWRNGLPYVYRSERRNGEPKNIYVAPLGRWYRSEYGMGTSPPDVYDMVQDKDYTTANLITIAKIKHNAVSGGKGGPLEKKRTIRNAKIASAKSRFKDGGKYKEIADKLGISVNTAWRYVNEY